MKKKTPKKRAQTSYEKLKAENDKLAKMNGDLVVENEAFKQEQIHFKAKTEALKKENQIAHEYMKKIEKELSVLKPKEISFNVKNVEAKEETIRIWGGNIPVTASTLKSQLVKLEKEKEESERKIADSIAAKELEITKYIVNLNNEKNILTK